MARLIEWDALKLATAPAVEPISLAEAKAHLRIFTGETEEDDYISGTLIPAARTAAEQFLRRALITQTWDLYLDEWPCDGVIRLPRPPLQSVSSITYTDEDDAASTFSSSSYYVDAVSEPGRVLLRSGESWPTATLRVGPSIKVRFVAGYGAAGTSLPAHFLRAIYLLLAHYNEHREAVIDVQRRELLAVPLGVESLLYFDRFHP